MVPQKIATGISRSVSLLLIAIALLPALVQAAPLSQSNQAAALADFTPNQVVVKLTPSASLADVLTDHNATLIETVLASGNLYLLEVDGDAQHASRLLNADQRVLYSELNYLVDIPEANPTGSWAWGNLLNGADGDPTGSWAWGTPSESAVSTQYALNMIGLADEHADSLGAGVTIAVLDTGAKLDHSFYAAQLTAAQYDFVDDDAIPAEVVNGIDEDEDGVVDEAAGHGTHVIGIVHTVAPQAEIMPVRVLDSDGRGNLFTTAEAILFSAENGANIINLSLGIPFESTLLDDVIQEVALNGVVVIAAAGNDGIETEQFPAAFNNVIAVTAVDDTGQLTSFANYGSWVDIAAPGHAIYSSYPIGGFAYWSGTSMATPFVSGAAALLWDDVSLQGTAQNSVVIGKALGVDSGMAQNPGAMIPLLDLSIDEARVGR